MPAAESRAGSSSTPASSASATGSTASISAMIRSSESSSVSVISERPSRLIRFDVDSIESAIRPFRFSFARSSSRSRRLPAAMSAISRGDDLQAGREVLLARADVDPDEARCRCTARRSCRPSTPSRASRGSPGRGARTPTRRGSRRAARPRTGGGRCARSRARRRRRGTARCPCAGSAGRAPARARAACAPASASPAARRAAGRPARAGPATVSCSRLPAAASTMFPATYAPRWYAADRAPADRGDHLRAADHRPAERVLVEDGLREQVVDEVLRRVLDHRDLLQHDLALGVDVREGRREDHVRHHVERVLEMAVGDARVDDRVLARRGRVQLPAHLVEDLGDLLRVVRARALEEQVLDEVRDARLRVGLVARAGADPEPERDRADAVSRSVISRSPESSSERTYSCTAGGYSSRIAFRR